MFVPESTSNWRKINFHRLDLSHQSRSFVSVGNHNQTMESSSIHSTPQLEQEHDDVAWDNDDFVIPSFDREKEVDGKSDRPKVEIFIPSLQEVSGEEKVDVEPQASQSKKKRLKQKLKEADRNCNNNAGGRENKVDHLRELLGGGNENGVASGTGAKGSSKDWLDSHCRESEFDKK